MLINVSLSVFVSHMSCYSCKLWYVEHCCIPWLIDWSRFCHVAFLLAVSQSTSYVVFDCLIDLLSNSDHPWLLLTVIVFKLHREWTSWVRVKPKLNPKRTRSVGGLRSKWYRKKLLVQGIVRTGKIGKRGYTVGSTRRKCWCVKWGGWWANFSSFSFHANMDFPSFASPT